MTFSEWGWAVRVSIGRMKGRGVWRCQIAHPITGRRSSFSLGDDEEVARGIAVDLGALCELIAKIRARLSTSPAAVVEQELSELARSPILGAYHARAVAIVFGGDVPAARGVDFGVGPLADDDVGVLAARIAGVLRAPESAAVVVPILQRYESERMAALNRRVVELDAELKGERDLRMRAEREAVDLKRSMNLHALVDVGSVWDAFWAEYDRDAAHAKKSRVDVEKCVGRFMDSLPKKRKTCLGDIRAADVDRFVMNVKSVRAVEEGEEPAELSARSRNRIRANVSIFLTWAARRYDLAQNPMENTRPVPGERRNPDAIVAIRSEAEIREYVDAFKADVYWRAVVGVGVLAGVRYGELVRLRVDDVIEGDGYIVVRSEKTGRQRRVVIERTMLAGILKEYLEHRKGMKGDCGEWLFPSLVAQWVRTGRKKSPAGRWSDNGVFLRALREAVKGAKKTGGIWNYGPWEWRHTFGTILGHCGMNSREIATAMGNSETVASLHYVAPGRMGNRWGFLY